MSLPRIALSMGDPAGIGPELCCRVSNDPSLTALARIEVFGSQTICERVAEKLALPMPPIIHECCADLAQNLGTLMPGIVSKIAGQAAINSLEQACVACRNGSHAALVTAPIHKEAAQQAGFTHPGHTEFLAAACASPQQTTNQVAMALHGPSLTVVLATIHCSIVKAAQQLSSTQIVHVASLLHHALTLRLGRTPRLACLGLNPHAGEGGLFGDEETRIISPALQQLAAHGIVVAGPLAPDSAFTPSQRTRYDGYVCCYHDQGLIPFKMLHFDDGVNWTLGLPIIRTSPDHGTAFDIAWQGSASASSLNSAIRLAAALANAADDT